MNELIILSGIFALSTTLGHFTVGKKQFLLPMLEADFDLVAKKVMHSVFHYVSVFLILSSVLLLLTGMGAIQGGEAKLAVQFVALNYFAFAVWQLVIAIGSGIPKGPFKLFQWVFFILISTTALLGSTSI